MLKEIAVTDYALVENIRIEFGSGFSVLTGETGAGKSIIVGAISSVLGERTSVDVVRTGSDKCRIEAVFDLDDSELSKLSAEAAGIDIQDGVLIISREISASGKSTCRVNGQSVTATMLRSIANSLIDIHGQHDHQSLLSPATHIDIYDDWLGDAAARLREEMQSKYERLGEANAKKEQLNKDVRERERKIDLLSFQVSEIDAAGLLPGEYEELTKTSTKLASAEKLAEGADTIYRLFSEENALIDTLQEAALICDRMMVSDPELQKHSEQLNELSVSAEDLSSAIREYRENIELDQSALEEVENRISQINNLKRKYGDNIEEILAFRNLAAKELDELTNADKLSEDLDHQIAKLKKEYDDAAGKLSQLRKAGAQKFANGIEHHLADLAMGGTSFVVQIEESLPGAKGKDTVEFLFCANPGEPVKSLSKIASGGEISRVMLAIKTVCSDSGIPTLIFDEIDSGIGGVTGQVLGRKISALSENCQILCVTHLPQVASAADLHLSVTKSVGDGHTSIKISQLDGDARVIELARMLGSTDGSETAIQHAREMLKSADKRNSKIR